MANSVSSVGFTPTDYSAEQADIERRRQYAQALQQQGMQPIESQSAGGWTIPISPVQGLAKMLQSYTGRKGQEAATEEQKKLGQTYQSDLAQTLMRAQQAGQGTPAGVSPGSELSPAFETPAVAPDRQAMARILMGHPGTQPLAMASLTQDLTRTPQSMLGKIDPKDYTPESFTSFMSTGNPAVLKAREKLHFADTGGGIQPLGEYSGAPVGSPITKGMTPDASANLDFRKMEFNNLSANQRANLAQEAQKIGISLQSLQEGRVQIMQDAEGNVHLVNKITGTGTTATGANGQPLNIPKPLTETQGKATLFGTRAEEADQVLKSLENNISTTGLSIKRGLENIPAVGGPLGAAGNAMLSKDQQKVEQAQRNFVNAVLRVESGAAISESEFKNAVKQYFPQPGDAAPVIEQKRQNRATAINGLKVMAGRGTPQSSVITNPGAVPGAVSWADLNP